MASSYNSNTISLTIGGTTYKEYFTLDVYNVGYTIYWSITANKAAGGTNSRLSIFGLQVNGDGSSWCSVPGEITYSGYSYGNAIRSGSNSVSSSAINMSAGGSFYTSSGNFATTGSVKYYLTGLCDCETACELNCQYTCESYCQDCEGSCQTTCENSCQTQCQICEATCQVYCQTQCQICEAACQITTQTSYLTTVPSQSGSLTYNGNQQQPSWNNFNTSQLTIGGTLYGTDAGSYTVTFTPKSGYAWSDGSAYKQTTWAINKASASITPPATQRITDSQSHTISYANTGNGTVSALSSNINVCTVIINTNTKQLTITPVNNGSATITLTSTSTGNYNSASASFTVNVGIAAYNSYVKIDGTWKQANAIYQKIDGVWRLMSDIKAKIDGTWR